jgi:hypothetical protein
MMKTKARSALSLSFFSVLALSTALSTGSALASGPDVSVNDNFTVTFNGRASLMIGFHTGDLISDPGTAGSTWSNPGTNALTAVVGAGSLVAFDIPDEEYWTMSNNYTRFGFTATGDTALGAFKAQIEGDFNGAGNTLRIRHAYGQVGPILAGQTWSLWNEGHASVSNWDWNGDPVSPGNNIARRQQLRYTTTSPDGIKLSVAIEDGSDITTAYTGLYTFNPSFFDVTANVQATIGDAEVTVSGIYSAEDDGLAAAGAPAQIDGVSYGVAASAKFDLNGWDAGVVGVYSDGGAGLGKLVNTGGEDSA